MTINPITEELINQATEKLSGWDYSRGNYTETYCDKHKLVKLVVSKCAEFIEQDQGSGELLADRLKDYFGLNNENTF